MDVYLLQNKLYKARLRLFQCVHMEREADGSLEVSSRRSAYNFLRDENLHKDCSMRTLSWLILLDIANPSDLQSEITRLHREYQLIIKENSDKSLSNKEENQIIVDIRRTSLWFERLRQETTLDAKHGLFVSDHSIRILRMLSLRDGFYYIQGYDRYVLVTYLLALFFTSSHGKSPEVAEALSFFLSRAMLQLANPKVNLTPSGLHSCDNLDVMLRAASPEAWTKLISGGHSCVYFALRWKLVLFADEHQIHGIWYLWDNLIAHKSRFDEYLSALCIAHILQVPLNASRKTFFVQAIQNFRNWDEVKLVRVADQRMSKFRKRIAVFTVLAFIVLLCTLLLQYLGADLLNKLV